MSRIFKKTNRYDNYVTYRYRLTREEYNLIVSQPCGICGTTKVKRVLDHDHAVHDRKQSIRGALCNRCNSGEGWFKKHKEQVLAWQTKSNNVLAMQN